MPYQALNRGGKPWVPEYIQAINSEICLGCGRCFKVCGFDVLALKAVDEDGEFLDDPDDGDVEKMVMTIANPDNCVGCQACARVCAKSAQSHSPEEVLV